MKYRKQKNRRSRSWLFQGELMVCSVCGLQKLSDPKVESNWTAVTFPDEPAHKPIYFCPACFAGKGVQ